MKNLLIVTSMFTALVIIASPILAKNTDKRTLSLSASDINSFRIDATAGDLSIEGIEDLKEIKVTATIRGFNIDEEDYRLELSKNAKQAELIVDIDSGYFSDGYIDIEIKVPQSLSLEISDTSGDISLSQIKADVSLEDKSGDLEIRFIDGSVDVRDRSGDLIIMDVVGNITLQDRSGDILLSHIEGDLYVQDRSGDIEIKQVNGTVTINDSSGDITIKDATAFVLEDDSSGDVELINVRNDANLQ